MLNGNFRVRTALLSLGAALLIATAAAGEDLIAEISPGNSTILLYDPFIAEIKIQDSFADPYDPREVELNAYFMGPDGKEAVAPGFFNGSSGKWEVRHTPVKTGKYSYCIGLRSAGHLRKSAAYSLEVKNARRCNQYPFN